MDFDAMIHEPGSNYFSSVIVQKRVRVNKFIIKICALE